MDESGRYKSDIERTTLGNLTHMWGLKQWFQSMRTGRVTAKGEGNGNPWSRGHRQSVSKQAEALTHSISTNVYKLNHETEIFVTTHIKKKQLNVMVLLISFIEMIIL